MTAIWLREGRLSKGLTQKELSEQSNISVRSIQRIENGDITPRSHTLKTLAEILGLSFSDFQKEAQRQNFLIQDGHEPEWRWAPAVNSSQRKVLSLGISLLYIFLTMAFISQSATFPETAFEGFLLGAVTLALITLTLFLLWRKA